LDNLDLRRAMALSIDRNAFTDTLTQGRGEIARRVVWYHA
jgi:ABC-type transport system substrate-binding protein